MLSHKNPSFRVDINGLRAWAVAAVVLYHFGLAGVSGGFVGVDVFFVISGFLMTGIVLSGLEKDSFSLWRFYLARGVRIWPALLVVCLVLLGLGWFFLVEQEYQRLGKHVRDSLLFSSNLRYMKEAGYFDVASSEKWLLHTWSLSVEWQFYLLYPLLLMLLWRLFTGRYLLPILATLLVLLLAFGIWQTVHDANRAFYVLQVRAWEMLAGGLVLLLGQRLELTRSWRTGVYVAGMVLIVGSILLLDASRLWPGAWAILPVLGASLVILAANQSSPLTASRPMQWLGDRSYSIYLWHWPVMVALAYLEKQSESPWVLGGILLSLLLGQLSYRLVETPVRRLLSAMKAGHALVGMLVGVALVAMLAQHVRKAEFQGRLPALVERFAGEVLDYDPRNGDCLNSKTHCVYGGERIAAILVGDSHAVSVANALVAALPAGSGVYFRGSAACLPLSGAKPFSGNDWGCRAVQSWLLEKSASVHPGVPMIIAGRTSFYIFGGLEGGVPEERVGVPVYHFGTPYRAAVPAFLEQFRQRYLDMVCRVAMSRPVYLLRPTPEMKVNIPVTVARDTLLGRSRDYAIPYEEYRQRHAFVTALQNEAAQKCGAKVLDPSEYLCRDGKCSGLFDGHSIYSDHNHLSEHGSQLLVPMFRMIRNI